MMMDLTRSKRLPPAWGIGRVREKSPDHDDRGQGRTLLPTSSGGEPHRLGAGCPPHEGESDDAIPTPSPTYTPTAAFGFFRCSPASATEDQPVAFGRRAVSRE